MRGENESRLSEVMRRAEINASSVLGEVTGEVRRVVEQSQAQTSHAVGSSVQELEKEIEVAASSATATSECATQMAMAKVRSEFQAQLDQTRAESLHRDEEAKQKMNEIAVNLSTLTTQLNQFKPASADEVAGSQNLLSSAVEEKINLQSVRIDTVSENVKEAQKSALDNAELLQNLLVGIENLGDNVKQLREEMNAWGEPGGHAELNELMQEVPEVLFTPEQPHVSSNPPAVNLNIPPMNAQILTVPNLDLFL